MDSLFKRDVVALPAYFWTRDSFVVPPRNDKIFVPRRELPQKHQSTKEHENLFVDFSDFVIWWHYHAQRKKQTATFVISTFWAEGLDSQNDGYIKKIIFDDVYKKSVSF